MKLDGVLVTWGDRLFYPGNWMVRDRPQPKRSATSIGQRAAAIRRRIEATVVRRSPQVMVKVTGGGRCMRAIAAHFRYISKNGRLEIETEQGENVRGPHGVRDLTEEWKYGGSLIAEKAPASSRREAINLMVSMPRGTDPLAVLRAARQFAREELTGHKYAMVLHDHQANPHVHISVRGESSVGTRLNPRKRDLQRWRETFAEKLRELGLDAEASRGATRMRQPSPEKLWRLKAGDEGRLRRLSRCARATNMMGPATGKAASCWMHIAIALSRGPNSEDRQLAESIITFLKRDAETPSRRGQRGTQFVLQGHDLSRHR